MLALLPQVILSIVDLVTVDVVLSISISKKFIVPAFSIRKSACTYSGVEKSSITIVFGLRYAIIKGLIFVD